MAYDEGLAQRVRSALAEHPGIEEKKMFGGLCFLLGGNMCCGVLRDELVVRVGVDGHQTALDQPHTHEMEFTGHTTRGFVMVTPTGLRSGQAVAAWVRRGVDFALSLPAKSAKSKGAPAPAKKARLPKRKPSRG